MTSLTNPNLNLRLIGWHSANGAMVLDFAYDITVSPYKLRRKYLANKSN